MPQFAPALLVMSGAQAVNQIAQGYAQNAEAKYNATLYEGKASMIQAQSEITSGQYDRARSQYMSKSIATVGKSGIMPQGSALAVIMDTQTQILIDQSIAKLNSMQEQNYAMQQAGAYRRAGSSAVTAGYANAFSTMLQGATTYAMMTRGVGGGTTTKTNSTFDSVASAPVNTRVSGSVPSRNPAGWL